MNSLNKKSSNNHIELEEVKATFTGLDNYLQRTHDAEECKKVLEHYRVLQKLLKHLSPIDFRTKTGLEPGEQLSKKHYLIETIKEVLTTAYNNNWGLCISDGFEYIYNGAYWKQLKKSEVESFLGAAALKLGVDKYDAEHYAFRAELFKEFLCLAKLPEPILKEDEIFINLRNGTFVITPENQELRAFDAANFLTYQLPFDFNPDAKAPIFQEYLDKVLPDEKKQMILAEYIGYLFIKQKTLKLEKSLLLYGKGANGKSVFFDIITALLGEVNVTHYSLQSLTNDQGYQRAKLKGVLCNYASEISPNMNSAIFKQLVSGEPVDARLPYKEPFQLVDYAKLICNANELPIVDDKTLGFYRRLLIIEFSVTIPENERDAQLASKIISTELPGVFNWVLEGLNRVYSQKKFTYSEEVERMGEDYQKQSDTARLFVEEYNYVRDSEKEISLETMYREFVDYCRASGCKALSKRKFSDRLQDQGFEKKRIKAGIFIFASKKVMD